MPFHGAAAVALAATITLLSTTMVGHAAGTTSQTNAPQSSPTVVSPSITSTMRGGVTSSPQTITTASLSCSTPGWGSSTLPSVTVSSVESRSTTLSVTESLWVCGVLDLLNAVLGVPNAAVTNTASGGRVVVLQPTERPDVHRPFPPSESARVLEAMAVPRVALVWTASEPVPLLMVWLPVSWANTPRWRVVSARSLLHGNATLDFIEDRPTDGSWTVTLHAPQSSRLGWLPGSVVMTESTWIMVALDLACAAAGGGNATARTTTAVVAVPAPGVAPTIAQAVATVATATQWTTTVGWPGTGSAVGRVGAVRSIVLCGNDDVNNQGPSGGGLLGVTIDVDDPSCAGGSSSASSARGAVVGNGGIVAFAAALFGLSTVAYAKARREVVSGANLRAASLRLCVPSVLLPVWIATLPSSAAGSAELLLGGSGLCGVDIVLGLLGLLMCIAPVVWICYVSFLLVPRLGLYPLARVRGPSTTSAVGGRCCWMPSFATSVCAAVGLAIARHTVWVSLKRNVYVSDETKRVTAEERRSADDEVAAILGTVGDGTLTDAVEEEMTQPSNDTSAERSAATSHASRQAQVLLHEFRVLPYAVVDVGVLVVSGVLSAVSGVGSHGLCVGAGSTIAVMYGLQLVVCVVTRPFTSMFALVHALMTLSLSCASVGLLVGTMSAATESDQTSLSNMEDLTIAAAACDLCVIGISGVRMLLDISGSLTALHRVLLELSHGLGDRAEPSTDLALASASRSAPGAVQQPSSARPLALPLVHNDSDTDDDLLPTTPEADDDDSVDNSKFWDADGKALILGSAEATDAEPNADDDDLLGGRVVKTAVPRVNGPMRGREDDFSSQDSSCSVEL